jgi:hypothetical protein
MRLLVGTLYSIENEYDECCKAIKAQTYHNYEHIVIENLPKKEAHDTLYRTFMSRRDEYDLLIKVDADMVIEKTDLFERIVNEFDNDSELDMLLIAVHDFFTDRLMIGMNIFRNTVRWRVDDDNLFTDMKHIKSTVRKVKKDSTDLAPAAIHCKNPGNYQAFHFGFHRAMKAIKGGTNWRVLFDVISHYHKNSHLRLAYVLLGAHTAFDKRFDVGNISYTDTTLEDYFSDRIATLGHEEVHQKVRQSKIVKLSRLPVPRNLLYRYYLYKSRIFS